MTEIIESCSKRIEPKTASSASRFCGGTKFGYSSSIQTPFLLKIAIKIQFHCITKHPNKTEDWAQNKR